jgi:chemotaxis protein MotA
LCYGFLGPLASNLGKLNEEHAKYLQFLRMAILAVLKGMAPSLAVEFARRAIPTGVRPSFKETETACKARPAGAGAAAGGK